MCQISEISYASDASINISMYGVTPHPLGYKVKLQRNLHFEVVFLLQIFNEFAFFACSPS